MGAFMTTMRNFWPVFAQAYPPRSSFSVDQIPDLTGRVMLVTGGNTGIGYETVKALLAHNATVYLAARDRTKATAAIAALREETGRSAIFLELDLASLASVKCAAEEFLAKEPALHALFNNAGAMNTPHDQLTAEGYDLQWGTNVLGHFYLTELLLPALTAGARGAADQHARVVTTASSGAYLGEIVFDAFHDGPARRAIHPEFLYFMSKLGNVIVARQAALRYADKGIVSISLNPGNLDTELYRTLPPSGRKIVGLIFHAPPQGALTQLYAGTMPGALKLNGEYMIPWARAGRCKDAAYDEELGRAVWAWCAAEVKAFEARLQ